MVFRRVLGRRPTATAGAGNSTRAGKRFGPVDVWVLCPFEDRFERPWADLAVPDGIIVLGGAISAAMYQYRTALTPNGARNERGGRARPALSASPNRLHRWSSNLLSTEISEAEAAKQFFAAMGLPPERMIYETRVRNTFENAD